MLKLTKIVATISDKRCDINFIKQLFDAGMNVIRLNTAHMQIEAAKTIIDNAREVSSRLAILIDTKGPEIRITSCEKEFVINRGDEIHFAYDKSKLTTRECIYVNYEHFVKEIPVGAQILIDDAELEFKVIGKDAQKLLCKTIDGGPVKSRKSVNVPGVALNLPSLNPKDIEFINFAIKEDVAFIAHSFVRDKEDVFAIQKILDENNSKIKIIAKIENQQGVDNIDEILDHCYGIMIARGDLGVEIQAEKIPAIQKMLNKKAISRRKPVIVATQMLHTMIENPRPTRAEVSDVANAIYDGADAVMLSGETASGQFPVEAVETMTKIAIEIEQIKKEFHDTIDVSDIGEINTYLTRAAVKASVMLGARAIVADSITGKTIRNIAAFRGCKPVFAICYNYEIVRELALSYGVFAVYLDQRKSTDEFLHQSMNLLMKQGKIGLDDLIVVVAGNFGSVTGPSFLEVSTCENLLNRF